MKLLALVISLVLTSHGLISQPNSNYQLVFFDDFNSSNISPSDWAVDNCKIPPDDDPITFYMQENAYTDNSSATSCLVLRGMDDSPSCDITLPLSGARANSVSYKYGYFEFRAWLPGGYGVIPAIWFWDGTNDTQYSEIDILEMCSENCSRYKTTFYWDDNNNGEADYNNAHTSDDILLNGGWNSTPNLCTGYNTFGLEWTQTHLRWYFNGELVQESYNLFTHQPMSLILSLTFGDLFGCGEIYGPFPMNFLIDWVKIYKETNSAITLLSEQTDICVGQETVVYAPIFGAGAVYNWTYDETELEITEKVDFVGIKASEMPGFQGSWKSVKVKGLTPGNHSLQLTITFPSGYVETKHIAIYVTNELPQPQEWIQEEFVEEPTCCYKVSTNVNNDAISYVWTITPIGGIHPHSFQIESPTNQLDYCFEIRKNYNISVQAKNLCGLSEPINELFYFPTPPPCDRVEYNRFRISPNPSDGNIVISIVNEITNLPISHIDDQIYILDYLGNIKYTITQPTNPVSIDLSSLDNGLYRVVTNHNSSVLQESFILNKE